MAGIIYQPYYNYQKGPEAALGRMIWGVDGLGEFHTCVWLTCTSFWDLHTGFDDLYMCSGDLYMCFGAFHTRVFDYPSIS